MDVPKPPPPAEGPPYDPAAPLPAELPNGLWAAVLVAGAGAVPKPGAAGWPNPSPVLPPPAAPPVAAVAKLNPPPAGAVGVELKDAAPVAAGAPNDDAPLVAGAPKEGVAVAVAGAPKEGVADALNDDALLVAGAPKEAVAVAVAGVPKERAAVAAGLAPNGDAPLAVGAPKEGMDVAVAGAPNDDALLVAGAPKEGEAVAVVGAPKEGAAVAAGLPPNGDAPLAEGAPKAGVVVAVAGAPKEGAMVAAGLPPNGDVPLAEGAPKEGVAVAVACAPKEGAVVAACLLPKVGATVAAGLGAAPNLGGADNPGVAVAVEGAALVPPPNGEDDAAGLAPPNAPAETPTDKGEAVLALPPRPPSAPAPNLGGFDGAAVPEALLSLGAPKDGIEGAAAPSALAVAPPKGLPPAWDVGVAAPPPNFGGIGLALSPPPNDRLALVVLPVPPSASAVDVDREKAPPGGFSADGAAPLAGFLPKAGGAPLLISLFLMPSKPASGPNAPPAAEGDFLPKPSFLVGDADFLLLPNPPSEAILGSGLGVESELTICAFTFLNEAALVSASRFLTSASTRALKDSMAVIRLLPPVLREGVTVICGSLSLRHRRSRHPISLMRVPPNLADTYTSLSPAIRGCTLTISTVSAVLR